MSEQCPACQSDNALQPVRGTSRMWCYHCHYSEGRDDSHRDDLAYRIAGAVWRDQFYSDRSKTVFHIASVVRTVLKISEAGSWKAPVAQRRIGAAVTGLTAALFLCLLLAACGTLNEVRKSAYYPSSMTVVGSLTHDDEKGWDRQTVGVGFTWPLKPSATPSPGVSPQPSATRNIAITP